MLLGGENAEGPSEDSLYFKRGPFWQTIFTLAINPIVPLVASTDGIDLFVTEGATTSRYPFDTLVINQAPIRCRDQPPAHPSNRTLAATAEGVADALLFGGVDANEDRVLGDTWRLSEGCWSEIGGVETPRPRSNAALASALISDPINGDKEVYLLTGGESSTLQPDAWLFEDNAWRPVQPPIENRVGAAMVYDNLRERFVVFGGSVGGAEALTLMEYSLESDTWTYPRGPDFDLKEASAFYDAATHRTLVFGGSGQSRAYVERVAHDPFQRPGMTASFALKDAGIDPSSVLDIDLKIDCEASSGSVVSEAFAHDLSLGAYRPLQSLENVAPQRLFDNQEGRIVLRCRPEDVTSPDQVVNLSKGEVQFEVVYSID